MRILTRRPPKAADEALGNDGLFGLNGAEIRPSTATLVVLGAPRGGTSMAAGALAHLGVYMGEMKVDWNYEDRQMLAAIEEDNRRAIEKLVDERNARYPVWGWKQAPMVNRFFRSVAPRLRAPRYLVVFRDPLAVAKRNYMSAYRDLLKSMATTLRRYDKLIDFVAGTKSPVLLASYEKALIEPRPFVEALAEFAGADRGRIDEAIRFIEPSPLAYRVGATEVQIKKSAAALGYRGVLDVATPTRLAGWAMATDRRAKPVAVDLVRNGHAIMTIAADEYRRDLAVKMIHRNGRCGFEFSLPPEQALAPGEEVRVRFAGTDQDLENSPMRVSAG